MPLLDDDGQRFAPPQMAASLKPLLFDSYDEDSPRLRRLRAEEHNTSAGEAAMFSVMGTAVSAFDTIAETLGVTDKNTTEEFLAEAYPEFGQFFLKHRDGFQIAGDVAGLIGTAVPASLAVRSSGFIGRNLTKMFGNRVTPFLSTGKSVKQLSEEAVIRARYLGQQPQMRALQADKYFKKVSPAFVARRRVADFAVEAVAAEAAIVATMHGSEFLFPEESTAMENAVWALGTNAVIGLGFWWHGLRGATRLIQETAGPLKKASTNPDDIPFTELMGIGSGGSALAAYGHQWNVVAQQAANTADADTLSRIATTQTAIEQQISKYADQAARHEPIPQATRAHSLTPEEAKTAITAARTNPDMMLGVTSLEEHNVAKGMTAEGRGDALVTAKNNLVESGLKLKEQIEAFEDSVRGKEGATPETDVTDIRELMTEKQKLLYDSRLEKLQEIKETIVKINRQVPITILQNGDIAVGESIMRSFQDGERNIFEIGKDEKGNSIFRADGGIDQATDNLNVSATAAGRGQVDAGICPLNGGSRMQLGKAAAVGFGLAATAAAAVGATKYFMQNVVTETLGAKATLEELVAQLRSYPPVPIDTYPSNSVQAFRRAVEQNPDIPEQMIVFGNPKARGKYKRERDAKYSKPVIVTANDMLGVHEGILYADIPLNQDMTSATFDLLPHTGKTAIWDVLQKQLETAQLAPNEIMSIASNAKHHTQLDYAIEMMGNRKLFSSWEPEEIHKLWFRSLASKFEDYQDMMRHADQVEMQGSGEYLYRNRANVAAALNLDADAADELLTLFDSLRLQGETAKLTDTHDDMIDIMRSIGKNIGADPQQSLQPKHFRGAMLNMPRDQKVVGGYIDNGVNLDGEFREVLTKFITQERATAVEVLQKGQTPIIGQVVKFIRQNSDMMAAIKSGIQTILEGAHLGGRVTRIFTQQHHALRDLMGAEPLDAAIDHMQKIMQKTLERNMQAPSGFVDEAGKGISRQDIINEPLKNTPKGVAALQMFHIFRATRAQGWDLSEENLLTVTLPDGGTGYQFKLGSSGQNFSLMQQLYKKDLPDQIDEFTGQPIGPAENRSFETSETLIPVAGSPGTPLTIPEDTFRVVKVIGDVMSGLLDEVNVLREAQGMKPLKKRSFWLPPQALQGKEVIYLVNEAGKVERLVSDLTKSGAEARAAKEVELAGKEKRTLVALNHDTIQRYGLARLEAIFDAQDYSSSVKQTGPSQGKTAAAIFDTGIKPYQAMTDSMFRAHSDMGRELWRFVFKPEMQYLEMEHAASGAGPNDETIFSFIANRINGTQQLNPNTFVGRGMLTVGNGYDAVLTHLANKLRRGDDSGARRREGERVQKALRSELGEVWRPFDDTLEYIERTHRAVIPGTLRKHAAVLSEITTNFAIRIFDLGMMVINMASLTTTIPAVVRMSLPMRNEAHDRWQNRVLAFGGITPAGTPWMSTSKIVTSGFRWMLTKEAKAVRERANARGYLDQYASEAIGLYDDTGQKFITRLLRKGVDVLSIPTDKSERLARGTAFMTFYHFGKKGLNLDDEAAMVFAHKQANNTIADFRPSNRPEIFQGAAGMPLALFTTYMWNFLQRIFRIIETGDARTAAVQFGLQTSLFGVNSLPGAQAYIQALGTNEDGTVNTVDRINQVLGRNLTDVLMHGGVSTFIPRSLGLGGGIDIGSRAGIGLPFSRVVSGDVVRDPSQLWENLWKLAPGLQFLGRVWGTGQKVIDRTLASGGFDPTEAAEILAASNIHKGFSNMTELVQGYAIDHANQKIEEDTRTRIGVAARIAGFKPLKTTQTREQLRRINNTKKIQNGMKQKLGGWMRTELRKGTLTGEKLNKALADYTRAGGSPQNFKNWFLSQVRKGTQNKLDMALAEAVRKNDADGRVARLLFMMQDDY